MYLTHRKLYSPPSRHQDRMVQKNTKQGSQNVKQRQKRYSAYGKNSFLGNLKGEDTRW